MRRLHLAAPLLALAAAPPAAAVEPIRLGGARLSVGGEASFSLAERDRGFFDETDYQRNALRLARLSLSAELRAGRHLAALAELRSEDLDGPRAYALYLRIRPWADRAFDVQAGRIPPVFGAFPRRRYGSDNPLIGYPLAYQYLTTLRADALPADTADLLRRRGGGWLVSYPIGPAEPQPGLPLVNAFRWDTGVEVRLGDQPLQVSAALTQGTLSSPRVRDDNDGKQVSARVAWQPATGWVLGLSGARGQYLDRALAAAIPAGSSSSLQQAWGADLEWSGGYWIARAELVWSEWEVPTVPERLRAVGIFAEARYRVAPGLSLAARIDHLGFNHIQAPPGSTGYPDPAGTAIGGSAGWDAPVSRVEAGLAYVPCRNVILKVASQHNWRDGGFVRRQGFLAGQLVLWF